MPKPKTSSPSQPLLNQRHEAFALGVANAAKLLDAAESAGLKRDSVATSRIRWRPEVDARIRWLAKRRVEVETKTFARRKIARGDVLERTVKELESIAFSDIGEIANWQREPILNADGEVIDYRTTLQIKDSAKLTSAQRAMVKSAFTKSGEIRLELHDKLSALLGLHKALIGKDAPASVTVNQVNVGAVSALEAARKVHYLLAVAANAGQIAAPRQPVTIEAKADETPGE